jgi:hypothetical protein
LNTGQYKYNAKYQPASIYLSQSPCSPAKQAFIACSIVSEKHTRSPCGPGFTGLSHLYQEWIEGGFKQEREPAFYYILARWIERSLIPTRLAMAKAMHPLLGNGSPSRNLPRELLKIMSADLWPVDSERD